MTITSTIETIIQRLPTHGGRCCGLGQRARMVFLHACRKGAVAGAAMGSDGPPRGARAVPRSRAAHLPPAFRCPASAKVRRFCCGSRMRAPRLQDHPARCAESGRWRRKPHAAGAGLGESCSPDFSAATPCHNHPYQISLRHRHGKQGKQGYRR